MGVSARNDTDYGSFLVRSEYVGFVKLCFFFDYIDFIGNKGDTLWRVIFTNCTNIMHVF